MRGIALALALILALPASAQESAFRVFNRTGEVAIGLHVGGGRNLIAGRAMRPGAGVQITAPGCNVDLRMVLASGQVLDWNRVNVCVTREVFFTAGAPHRPGPSAPAQAPTEGRPAAAQRALAALGYDPGPPDGVIGPRTRHAITSFQRDQNLPVSGELDTSTLAALGRAVAGRAPAPDGKPPPVGEARTPPPPRSADGKPPAGIDRPVPLPAGIAPTPRPGGRTPPAEAPPRQAQRRASTGTGFIVAEGRVLTNHHVVDGCNRTVGVLATGRRVDLSIGPRDPRRDLALLSGPHDMGPALAFRDSPPRRGDEVVTYGFPLTGILGSGPTLTTGEVSALTGLRDDPNTMIVSAPVQAGNSGGPLLDRAGNVLGVIVAKLAALRIAERTGDLPQNVNIAIHGRTAIDFLRQHGVTARRTPSIAHYPAAEVGEIAHASTLLLECFK
ncbi:trypsin-like peptidase domain-containing protein [Elioraea sp.]|uniref:trypsin-like peptidase domain-containing protein n=1 Tax=Elioraea sp. TaxID=2185103 RepID=UPI003F70A1EA